jgi:hypothetical protein
MAEKLPKTIYVTQERAEDDETWLNAQHDRDGHAVLGGTVRVSSYTLTETVDLTTITNATPVAKESK